MFVGGWVSVQLHVDTLDMSDEWVGILRMKYFDIVAFCVWVGICTVTVPKMKYFDTIDVHGWWVYIQ